ncbi:MAG TPA: hypothetical protein VGM83_08225 [Devosiaceae bacterium]|jgi:hypothetical protein
MSPIIKQRPHSVRGVMEMQSMLIPSVEMLAAKIAAVPAGEITDLGVIRAELARQHGTDATCPVTVQRQLRDMAAVAVAAHQRGDPATPFWRIVDASKPSARRLAGGPAFICERQADERRSSNRGD